MSSSQSSKQTAQQDPATNPAAMELMQPGPEHTRLAKTVGTWDVSVTHWPKPGEPPHQTKGTSTFVSVYDGRYLREEFTGDFNGKPFSGTGTIGYDRAAKHYVTTWYDSMGTGIAYLTGTGSPDSREVIYRGSMVCAGRPGTTQMRHVLVQETDDRFSITMFSANNGPEQKSMELIYTRRR